MVLTWLVSNSERNADCLRCFFAMRDSLSARADYYHKTYGLAPTFKAGIHCGGVTTGEIGVIKRDIIFTGDVLNSAARIQGLCNTYQSDLLVSADLLEAMDLPPDVKFQSVGSVALRGRDEEMKVLALSRS